MIRVLYENAGFAAEIEYAAGVLLDTLGLPWRADRYGAAAAAETGAWATVSYGRTVPRVAGPHVHIREGRLFGEGYLAPRSLPAPPQRDEDPAVAYPGEPGSAGGADAVVLDGDIVASAFFLLTGYEEIVSGAADEHGRFPGRESFAGRRGLCRRPLVHEYCARLRRALERVAPRLPGPPRWPGDAPFAAVLTHDVDMLRAGGSPRHAAGAALAAARRGALLEAVRGAGAWIATRAGLRRDPADTFDALLAAARDRGLHPGTWFLMAGTGEPRDAEYALDDPRLGALVRRLHGAGAEIGLHPGYAAFERPERVASERRRLEAIAPERLAGVRSHYLRWRAPHGWRAAERAGFRYDATGGFADRVGFRFGYCLPFRPFDVLERRRMDLLELPLIVMDATLRDARYEGLGPAAALDAASELIRAVQGVGGVFALLWHNSSFGAGWEGWERVHAAILDALAAARPFSAAARDVVALRAP